MATIEQVKPGVFFKHFKGNIYIVDCLAKDSETQEVGVVYHNPQMPDVKWFRLIDSFTSYTQSGEERFKLVEHNCPFLGCKHFNTDGCKYKDTRFTTPVCYSNQNQS